SGQLFYLVRTIFLILSRQILSLPDEFLMFCGQIKKNCFILSFCLAKFCIFPGQIFILSRQLFYFVRTIVFSCPDKFYLARTNFLSCPDKFDPVRTHIILSGRIPDLFRINLDLVRTIILSSPDNFFNFIETNFILTGKISYLFRTTFYVVRTIILSGPDNFWILSRQFLSYLGNVLILS